MKWFLPLLLLSCTAFAGEPYKEIITQVEPEVEDGWEFKLAVPGWAAGLDGDVGVNGLVSNVDVSPETIIRSIDMAVLLRGEVSKGRFGVMGDFVYLSLSDSATSETAVQKIDLQVDEIIGELALRYRLVEGPRGWLDIYGGLRYVNLHQAIGLQPNSERIDEVSTQLVDAVGERVRTRLSESGLRDLVEQRLESSLVALENRKPELPVGPLAGRGPGVIRDRISSIIEERKEELAEAVRARVEARTAALRAKAEKRIEKIKSDLSEKIADTLESELDTKVSRTDDWWDPFIGLRGRLNISDAWYLIAKADIGGFGVGSDLAWQAEAALGCQVTRHIFVEIGYRALSMDYNNDGLTFDTLTHGGQITTGIVF